MAAAFRYISLTSNHFTGAVNDATVCERHSETTTSEPARCLDNVEVASAAPQCAPEEPQASPRGFALELPEHFRPDALISSVLVDHQVFDEQSVVNQCRSRVGDRPSSELSS